MDMNTMERWKRGLFSTIHRYNLQYTPTTVTPKEYGVYITETNLSFKVFADQTPHSNSKSPDLQGGGSAVVVVHRITHCEDAKVGSQPGMLKQIRQRTRTRDPWRGLVSGSLQACTSGKLQPRERYLARDPELSVQDGAFAQRLLGLFKTALPTCQAEHASVV